MISEAAPPQFGSDAGAGDMQHRGDTLSLFVSFLSFNFPPLLKFDIRGEIGFGEAVSFQYQGIRS